MKGLIVLFLSFSLAFGLSVEEVAEKSKEVTDGFGASKSVMQMVLIDTSGNKSVREIESFVKEGKKGDKSLIKFLKPLDVKGVKFLTHEKIGQNNHQWLYMPALKRVKRINSSNKSGSFMGSEFSYEDISSRDVSKYTYDKKLHEEKVGDVLAFRFERYPKDENSGYSKQIVWVDKDKFTTLKIDYYDRKKELLKTSIFKWKGKINNTYRVSEIFMSNHQNKKSTILKYLNDEINLDLDNSLFTKRMLNK